MEWVDTARYLGVTLDIRLTRSPNVNQIRKTTVQGMSMLGPLLSRKNDQSVRNGVLLHKHLIRPQMNYACNTWGYAAAPMSGGYRC